MDYANAISLALAVIGLASTVHYGKLAKDMQKRLQTIEWNEIQTASDYLKGELNKKDFLPDLIISPDNRGGIIAHIIAAKLPSPPIIISGMTRWKEDFAKAPEIPGYWTAETSKWYILLPDNIKNFANKKLLIVDDQVMSGDAMILLKKQLLAYGFGEDNIKTCSVACSSAAIDNKKEPDFFWHHSTANNLYLPWGKAK